MPLYTSKSDLIKDFQMVYSLMTKSSTFAGRWLLYQTALPSLEAFNAQYASSAYPGWVMSDEVANSLGHTPAEDTFKEMLTTFFANRSDLAAASEPSVIGFTDSDRDACGKDILNTIQSKIIKMWSISRTSYYNVYGNGSDPGGGGGGAPPRILDFLVGGMWGPRYFDGQTFDIESTLKAGFLKARRPPGKDGFRSFKKNDYATIYVVDINGMIMFKTSNFKLQSVAKKIGDQLKKISTQEGTTLSFSCEKNMTFQFDGVFVDTADFDWARQWRINWENYLRGQVTARNLCKVVIIVNNVLTAGYLVRLNGSQDATQPYTEGFGFSMFVTDHIMLPTIDILDTTGQVSDYAKTTGDYYYDKGKRPLDEINATTN